MRAKFVTKPSSYNPNEKSFTYIKTEKQGEHDIYITKVSDTHLEFIGDSSLKLRPGDKIEITKTGATLEIL